MNPASTLLLSLVLMLSQPQGTREGNGVIEGTVTRFGSGDPIANVEILMNGAGEDRSPLRWLPAEAITDSSGHFVIDNVPPGTYTMQAQRSGYANPAPNGVRVKEGGTARTVTVAAGKRVEGANFTLVPAGVVTGRIFDSRGKPFAGGSVSAIAADDPSYRRSGQTNDRGEYHVVGLSPGNYYVTAYGAGSSEVQTYFPGTADKTKGRVLEIAEGAILSGIDISIQVEAAKTFTISGKVVNPDGSAIQERFQDVRLKPRGPLSPVVGNIYRESGGSSGGDFYFTGVRPGSYSVYLAANDDAGLFNRADQGVVGRVAVDVSGEDLKDVTIFPGGVAVRGQLSALESVQKPSGTVRLKMATEDIQSRKTNADAAGAFTITNVLSGTWKVEVSDLSANLAVLDIRQGKVSIHETGFAVEDQTPEPVEVILGAGSAIEGIVRDDQQAPFGAAKVFLIPAAHDPSRPALYRRTTTDGAGRFTVPNVGVGAYRVFALDSAVLKTDSIPDGTDALRTFLIPDYQSQGAPVNVSTGANTDVSIVIVRTPALNQQ